MRYSRLAEGQAACIMHDMRGGKAAPIEAVRERCAYLSAQPFSYRSLRFCQKPHFVANRHDSLIEAHRLATHIKMKDLEHMQWCRGAAGSG